MTAIFNHRIKMYSDFIDIYIPYLYCCKRGDAQYCTSLKVQAQNITQNYQTEV